MLSVKDYSDLQKSRGMSAVWDEGGQRYVDICKDKNIVVCEVVIPDEDGWNQWYYTVFKNGYERALLAYKGDLTYIIDDIKDTTCYQEDIDNFESRNKRFKK